MLVEIPFVSKAWEAVQPLRHTDMTDKLSYYVSSLLLLFFSVMVAGKQYFGKAIQCWCPAEYKLYWEQYAEAYCFVQNTYWIPITERIPEGLTERRQAEISYYQWVPIILALQALGFYLPVLVWKTFSAFSGIDLDSILKRAFETASYDPSKRSTEMKTLATYIGETIDVRARPTNANGRRKLCTGTLPSNWGCYLTSLYLLMKFLFVVNILGQFSLMNHFFGTKKGLWAIEILYDLSRGHDWDLTGYFPRVTMCDFDVREMGNIHHHSIQCVLMINIFSEKIYIFLWFWFAFVAFCSVLNFLYCLTFLSIKVLREMPIHRYLLIASRRDNSQEPGPERKTISRFIADVLKVDGLLIINFMAACCGDLVALDATLQLWYNYCQSLSYPFTVALRSKTTDTAFISTTANAEGALEKKFRRGADIHTFDDYKHRDHTQSSIDEGFMDDRLTPTAPRHLSCDTTAPIAKKARSEGIMITT